MSRWPSSPQRAGTPPVAGVVLATVVLAAVTLAAWAWVLCGAPGVQP